MAFAICPKCKRESFLWTSEGDPYIITDWYCHECSYHATEDERLEQRECPACGEKAQTILKDTEKEYWWCTNCDTITYDV